MKIASILDALSYCWEIDSFERLILSWMDSVAAGGAMRTNWDTSLLGFFCFEENRP